MKNLKKTAFLLSFFITINFTDFIFAQSFDEDMFLSSDEIFSDDELFGGSSSDDELFGGSSSDDELFGGSSSDDELFGGSSSDDELFGGSSFDDELFGGSSSDDDLFIDSMIDEIEVATENESGESLDVIFDSGSIRGGVSYVSTTTATAIWYDPWGDNAARYKYISDGIKNAPFTKDIDSSIYFDARITQDFRLYTKLKFDIPFPTVTPFNKDADGPPFITDELEVSLFEAFADYSIKDRIFLRAGKHTVTWGVGRYFSPADVINLSNIDPENPDKQKEGAVSLRAQVIFPGTQDNLWLYVLPDMDDRGALYTALAAKYEFLVDSYEFGIGGWFKLGRTPRLVATATGYIGRASCFAEAVLGYGTEEQWKPLLDDRFASVKYNDMKPVFQGTFGFNYNFSKQKIMIGGQYLYNGFGDKKPHKLTPSEFVNLQDQYSYAGRHYLAFSFSKSELFVRDLSFNFYVLSNIVSVQDILNGYMSGVLNASLDWKFHDKLTLSTGPSLVFGSKGSEFTRQMGYPAAQIFSWKLSLIFNAGRF